MLKVLRKKGVAKKILWAVAIVIIISFGFFGTATQLDKNRGASYAGKIFGKKVSFEEFEAAYTDVRLQAIMRYGDNFRNVQQFLNLEAEAWDRLILLSEAKKRRVKISNDAVIATVASQPIFQRNGAFDQKIYNDILAYAFRMTPGQFESSIRETLTIAGLYSEVTSRVVITEADVKNVYVQNNEKTQTSYILLPWKQFADPVAFNEEDAKKYFEANKTDFIRPPTINVTYITLPFPQPAKPADTTTEAPTISDEEKETVRALASTLADDLIDTPLLADVAKKHDLTVQESGVFSTVKPNLGLGWSYDILAKLFQLKEDEISEPFETPTGIYIAQIKEKQESRVPDYAEAASEVKETVMANAARTAAYTKAKEYRERINALLAGTKVKDFGKAAKSLNLDVKQTPLFSRGQYLPEVGISRDFQEEAFGLSAEFPLSDVIEVTNGYAILYRDAYQEPDMSSFEKEKDGIARTLSDEKRNEAFSSFFTRLRLEAKLEDNIAKQKEAAAKEEQKQ